jgi:hypothetical protein
MIVRRPQHLSLFELWSAILQNFGALTLANGVYDDAKPNGCKVFGQICRI